MECRSVTLNLPFLIDAGSLLKIIHIARRNQGITASKATGKGTGILTVRFTYRNQRIRIIGAGYWRRGKKIYEQTNSI